MNHPVTVSVLDVLQPIAESNPHAVVVVDARGLVVLANTAATRVFHFSVDELTGRPVYSLVAERFLPRFEELRRRAAGVAPAIRLVDTAARQGIVPEAAAQTTAIPPVPAGSRENATTPALLGMTTVATNDAIPGSDSLIGGVRRGGDEFPVEVGVSSFPEAFGGLFAVTFVDVSDRLRVERALRDTEAGYQSLVENLPLNVFCKDLQSRFVFVNRGFCEIVKHERRELLGRTDFDLFPRELAEKYVRDDRRVIETGRTFDDVEEHQEADGTKSYVQVLKAPVRDAQGTIVGTQGMFWDVTEKKRAEDLRKESEARKQAIFDAALDCIVTVDQENRIVEFNRAAERTFGYKRDEVAGQSVDLLFPTQSQERYHANQDRYSVFHEEGSLVGKRREIPARRKNGTQFLAEMAMQPIPLKGTTAFTIFLRDITERRRAEDALRRSDARFRSLVQSNILGIMICRLDGQVTEANDSFLQTIGYARDELLSGRIRWDEMTPDEHRAADQNALRQLAERGQATPWEKEYIRKDGSRVPVLLGVAMLEGSRNHCLCFVLDMTEQKRQERALHAAIEAADAANRAKTAFLASMSHEIRTPIHAILTATDLVLDMRPAPDQREYLHIVKDSGEQLLSLINDVLDFSKIEAGRLDSDQDEFRLRDAIGGTLKTLAVQAHAKNLELVADVKPDVPDRVLGDVVHFRQVLVNLVANAIKFTETGEVVVQAGLVALHDPPPEPQAAQGMLSGVFQKPDIAAPPPRRSAELLISVRDTGIGIPEKDRQRIFDPFEQVDNTMRRKVTGTGLGLAITTRLVQSMQGRVWCESEVGRGTTFHFTVRLPLADEPEAEEGAAAALRGLKALVVDDNASARQALSDMFLCWNATPVMAASGTAALVRLEQARREGKPFDLLLIDARMEGVDGFTVASEAQRLFGLPGARILMMLTSGDGSGDVARCEQLGIPAYLMKPVNQSELFDTLMAVLLGESIGRPAREPVDAPKPARTLDVLLVEDSLYNQKLALAVLARRGHRVAVANNGKEAVQAVRKRRFDIVLMDVQMPEMDGLEATRAIRQSEASSGRHVPIVAMTAQALKGDRERCLEAGMDDYLTKPVRAADLYATIERLAPGPGAAAPEVFPDAAEPRADTAGEAASREGAPREVTPGEAAPNVVAPRIAKPHSGPTAESYGAAPRIDGALIDWDGALDGVGGDCELLREVVAAFCEEAPQKLRDLTRAVETNDARLFERSAHTLKGGLRFLGASATADVAEALESAGRDQRLAGHDASLARLARDITSATSEVARWLEQPLTPPASPPAVPSATPRGPT